MTKGLWKDLFREIKRNKSRFLSIFFIVALGVAFFAGVRAAKPDMMWSADRYYDRQEFMDIRVISTMGLTDADVDAIRGVKGVSYAVGGHTKEVYCHLWNHALETPREETLSIRVYGYMDGINEPYLLEGEVPDGQDECLIDVMMASSYDIGIGDTVTLVSADDEEKLSDTLAYETYTVTGIGKSPWYLTFDRGTGSIGNGEIDFFLMVPQASFVTDVYTEVYIQADGARELVSGTDAYDEMMDTLVDRLSLLEDAQCDRRYQEIRQQAYEEAREGEAYSEAYSEAYEEALKQARSEAYEEALDSVKETAREEALEQAKAAAYEEALKQAKEEGLEEALKTAKETAREEALKTAKETAREEALAQVKQEAKQTAWEQALALAHDEALAQVKQEAYTAGWDSTYKKAEEAVRDMVAVVIEEARDQISNMESDVEQMPEELPEVSLPQELPDISLPDIHLPQEPETDPSETDTPGIGFPDVNLPDMDLPQVDLPDTNLPDFTFPDNIEDTVLSASDIYELVLKELKKQLAETEITPEQQAQLEADVLEAITPTLRRIYDEQFEEQFASIYQVIFELQFEDAFREEYGEEFDRQFEDTFQNEYLAQFDAEFEKTFNEQYLGQFDQEFDKTFDTQYAPLVEVQFEKTFEEEYLDTFNEEFEKGFADNLDTFDQEFEKTFEEEYLDDFNEEFEKNFADNLDTFEEKFNQEFEEEFDRQVDEELEDLAAPEWYIFGRGDSVATYIEYLQDADAIGKIGQVFPLMFFLVAALVALTTMTRMVEDERLQMGTLKALGYSNLTIAGKYLLYSLFATIGGSIIGSAFGEYVFPFVIMNAYGMLYTDLPDPYMTFQWDMALQAALAAIGCIVIAAFSACARATASKPAALMRPPAPKAGKRILLEHIGILWRHLSFTQKSSMRNLFRYKKRLFMTVFGIGGCMALLLVGFGLRDSILTIAKYQYREIFTYDVSVNVSADAEPEAEEALLEMIGSYEGVTEYMPIHTETLDAVSGEVSKELNVYVPESMEDIGTYMRLSDRVTGQVYAFPEEGVAISEKAADKLGLSVGDTVVLRREEGKEVSTTVSVIFENYINHYILMSHNTYTALFGEEPEYRLLFIKDESRDEAFERDFSTALMKQEACNGVTLVSELDATLDDMLSSLDIVVWVLIVSAGLLAFVVLYNLNHINISERRRELATIKVLGFYHGEVASYVYRDNIWLTVFGCIAGVFLGLALHRYVIVTVEVEIMMFGRTISMASYALAILCTTLFSVFVNFIMYFQLKKIDMVESLKSVE